MPNGRFLWLKSKNLLGETFLGLFFTYVKTFVLKFWSLLQFFGHLEKFTKRRVGLVRVGLIGHLKKFTTGKVGLIQKLKCQTADFSGSNQKIYYEKSWANWTLRKNYYEKSWANWTLRKIYYGKSWAN